ncbi:MAG: ABC transporter ATP-binding protein [Thermoplasmata archaeon]
MPDAVVVSHLTKTYGDVQAVAGVDFSIGQGEVFAFLGPNGAGKTTTTEILEGLRQRTSGEVRVLGMDPWAEADALHRRIGIIPQDFAFFPKITPREAIALWGGLFGTTPDVMQLLRQVELEDKARAYFDTLSGGQRQKLGLALALVNNPDVCFLDEPTTGLDPRARRSIWDVIRSLKGEGRTVFLTTHYLEEAQLLADRIAIINRGKIIAAGAPGDIIARYGRPERLRIVGPPSLADELRRRLRRPVEVTSGGMEVELRDQGDALQILTAAEAAGIPWQSFSTQQDTLEDVFIRLVGRMDEGAIAPPPAGPKSVLA